MTRLITSLTAALLGFGAASAQVVLLPLDSRPATSELPARIAGLATDDVRLPSPDLLGDARRGADHGRLVQWLQAQPAGPLIVALDALAYGGLVQSRHSDVTVDEALRRLEPVREWKRRTGRPVYAFITLPREPDATNRARNLAVARAMLDWARDGTLTELHVTWDDARTGSPAPAEGEALRRDAPANVRIYPGADEVLASLVARALAPEPARLAVEYSDPEKAKRIAQYEGIPLEESVRLHAEAAGWTVVPTAAVPARTPFGGTATRPEAPADLYLYVYNGGTPRASALRVSQLARRGRVAVADVASVNVGNVPMWTDLLTLERPKDLASLAAWGTPGNNIGTALAHARVFLTGAPAGRQDDLLARQFANDVIFGSKVRPELRRQVPEAELGTDEAREVLTNVAERFFPLRLVRVYLLDRAELPWNRSFEWRFDLKPAE